MACDITTIQADLCESGIGKVTNPVQLLQIIAQLACEVAENCGGGGGGGTTVTFTDTIGVVTLQSLDVTQSLEFPSLTSSDYFSIVSNTAMTALDVDALVTAAGDFAVQSNPALTSLLSGSLSSVTSNFQVNDNALLPSISFPSLVSVGGQFLISSSPSMASASFPSLITTPTGINANNSVALVDFSAPVWVPTDGTTISFFNCALSDTSVNLILARCVAAGVTTCTIDLSGGTSSAPTGQGIVDAAALVLAGNTVTTN